MSDFGINKNIENILIACFTLITINIISLSNFGVFVNEGKLISELSVIS